MGALCALLGACLDCRCLPNSASSFSAPLGIYLSFRSVGPLFDSVGCEDESLQSAGRGNRVISRT